MSSAKRKEEPVDLRIEKLVNESLQIARSNPHKGIYIANELQDLAQSIKSKSALAKAQACKGICQVWLGKYDDALKNLFSAIEQLKKIKDYRLESQALYHVFASFYFLADYDDAINYALEMLHHSYEHHDKLSQANALNAIGTVHYTTGEDEKAIADLFMGLEIASHFDDQHLIARLLDGLGSAYFNLKNIEKSIEYKKKSLDVSKLIGSKQIESYALDGLGKIYLETGDIKNAEATFLNCLAKREEIEFKSGIAETNLHLGSLYLDTNRLNDALKHLQQALAISEETNTKEVLYKTHKALAKCYELQNNTQQFVHHFKKYYALKDEYFSEKRKQKQASTEMQISILQMKKEKELLDQKNQQLEQHSKDLTILSDLGKRITSLLSVEAINKTVYKIINDLMDASGFGIGVVSDNAKQLHFPGYIEKGVVLGSSSDELNDLNRLSSICFNEEKEIVINDFDTEAKLYIKKKVEVPIGEHTNSIIYLPLKINERKLGVLTVQSFKKNAYSDYHVNLVKNLGIYCAIAIENATLYERLEDIVTERTREVINQKEEIERSHENTRLLSEIGQQIISNINFDSIFTKLHENVSHLMNADCFGVRIYYPKEEQIEYRYEIERGELSEPLRVSMDNHDNFSVWCVKNKKDVLINDLEKEYSNYVSKIVIPQGDIPHSILFCPMMIGERVLGVITVQSFKAHVYTSTDLDMLKTLASYTAIALENANLVEHLEEKVEERTKEILKQKEIIEENNKHITDSIKYAKRIQEAFLPTEEGIKSYLKNSFVIYKPKDIVSGDFYWVERKDNKILFAVVDCTGHGVPGAFMSIIGFNGLNQIVNEYDHTQPAEILNQLNRNVSNTLRQKVEDSVIRDGMDIAICSLDLERNVLEFAGANNPLVIIRDGEVLKIKGDKHPIGNYIDAEEYEFTNNEIELLPNDKIYIFSDGFIDQFGGPGGKKLKYANFKKLLLNNYQKPMSEQKKAINTFFEEWRKDFEQIDDVCVIGISI